jgi:predicted nucleic acid-binding protein
MIGDIFFSNCTRVFSEDLSHGQRYFGIEVVNPFYD